MLNPIHPGDHHLGDGGEPVTAVTLDELTAGDARPVGLIKIDVQGAELLVLAGAARVIAEDRPAIFMEVDDPSLRRFDTSAAELIARAGRAGLPRPRARRAAASARRRRPRRWPRAAPSSYIDVLFLPGVTAGTPAESR